MEMLPLNHVAIILSAVAAFVLGGLWYSLIFQNAWMKENNFTPAFIRRGNMPKIFGLSFVCYLIMAYNLAFFLGNSDLVKGALYGFLTGIWVVLAIIVIGLFERKTALYLFINGGYMLLSFTLMGLIIGAWH